MDITLDRPFAASEKGGRKNNEDFIYPLPEQKGTDQKLYLVCDGVGGAQKGEVASSLACESLQTYFDTMLGDENPTEEFINNAIRYTEAQFDEYIKDHPEAMGMGTTMTLLYLGTNGVTIAHLGDSRIYQFRDGNILRRTADHSLVQMLVQTGKLTEGQARHHPKRNVITRAIQGTNFPTNADVEIIGDLQPGDRFLMCTDGLTECFDDKELSKLFSSENSIESVKNELVGRCSEEAQDNFSFYILPVQGIQKNMGYKQYILSLFYSFI